MTYVCWLHQAANFSTRSLFASVAHECRFPKILLTAEGKVELHMDRLTDVAKAFQPLFSFTVLHFLPTHVSTHMSLTLLLHIEAVCAF